MNFRVLVSAAAVVCALAGLVLGGCGGSTTRDGASGAGGAMGGSGGVGGGSGGSAATAGVAGSGGGSPSGGSGGQCGVPGPEVPCGELDEARCLKAHPRCAPMYDDKCCPACDPTGACADCVAWEFEACLPYDESNCAPGTVGTCGETPAWACQGGTPECGPGSCSFEPGCVTMIYADCPPDALCPPECRAVTRDSCDGACAGGAPPSCPDGTTPETAGGKFTKYCLPEAVCGA